MDTQIAMIGPFLVLDLENNSRLYDAIDVENHGMEDVDRGKITKAHTGVYPVH